MTTPVIDEKALREAKTAGFCAWINLGSDRVYDDTVTDAIIEAYLTHAPQPDARQGDIPVDDLIRKMFVAAMKMRNAAPYCSQYQEMTAAFEAIRTYLRTTQPDMRKVMEKMRSLKSPEACDDFNYAIDRCIALLEREMG